MTTQAFLTTPAALSPLPLWQCHKQVRGCKIRRIEQTTDGWLVVPDDTAVAAFRVPEAYIGKHGPKAGGYYVEYAGGYQSYSPAKEFEEGYTLVSELAQRRARLEAELATVNKAIEDAAYSAR